MTPRTVNCAGGVLQQRLDQVGGEKGSVDHLAHLALAFGRRLRDRA